MKIRLLMLCLIAVLAGCGGEKEATEKPAEQKAEQASGDYKETEAEYYELDNPARELTEIEQEMLRKPGKYSGDNYDKEKVQQALDELPTDLSKEQYLEELLHLLAEDYHEGVETFVNFDTSVDINIERPDGKIDTPAMKKTHFALLIDSSGSMNGKAGGSTKMKAAKEAVDDFAQMVPESATVSLRVYGHKGSGSNADRKLSCSQTEQVFQGSYNEEKFAQSLNQFQPAGWTPIALALKSVKEDIPSDAEEVIVYVVSDGVETCDGDPVAAAKTLSASEQITTVVNIIGFDVDDEGQKLLKKVADAGDGEFTYVDSENELKDYMRDQYQALQEEWQDWKNEGKTKAKELEDKKQEIATDTKNELKEKSVREKERLKEAQAYLEEKYDDYDHPINDTWGMIIDRYNDIWGYAVDTGTDLWGEVVDNGNDEWSDYVDEGKKKIDETIDKKNDY